MMQLTEGHLQSGHEETLGVIMMVLVVVMVSWYTYVKIHIVYFEHLQYIVYWLYVSVKIKKILSSDHRMN